MRFAICISGLARTYLRTYDSFMRNVVGPLKERGEVDIFISIWDTTDLSALSPRAAQENKVDVNEIIQLYKPISIDIEHFPSLRDSFRLDRLSSGGYYTRSVVKDGILTAAPAQYKVLRANDLKCVHEQMGGFTYDLVVRTRFDVEITELKVDEMDLTKVNCLYDHDGLVGDYFYIANSGVMDRLAKLYINYPHLLIIEGNDMGPERTLKHHMVRENIDTHILTGYNFALIRDTFRQEFCWEESGYKPHTSMIICSALYYPGSLARGDLIVRDNRFYPGKYSETFLPWYQYLRRNYPNDHLVLFADTASPIPIQLLLNSLPEPYDEFHGNIINVRAEGRPKVHVRWLSKYAGQYFRPMQRNLVEGILTAYHSKENFLWIDNDAFLNTDLRPQIRDCDMASSGIEHHQMTTGSVCFYISSKRLHALNEIDIDLPSYLANVLNTAPQETRMHMLQEGGLYKTFCYGDLRQMEAINMSHLSCYDHYMTFLRNNPLDTPEYKSLVGALETFDFARIPGVERVFQDMLYSEKEGRISPP